MTAGGSGVASLRGVSLRYGETRAVDDVSLEIPANRMVGLIGPDGVGKSSLLALLAGARKMQDGEIRVLDGDMRDRRHRRAVCPRIAYMPQGLGKNLYPTLSVFENVDFFGRLFGHDKAERERRIADLLQSTGLAPFAERPAGKLSGGMKQKLGLCCALIHDPDLLILDEPTTGVDPLSRNQFWELIGRIRAGREGMSVLVATAYMEEAERFDWLVAMDDGKVLATGTPQELRERTGTQSLESAFIALLPESKRAGHHRLVIPPRPQSEGAPRIAIEAEGLTCRFGDFVAVDHVSFRIERGEIFGFLGSNGCGKSTTMKMLTGLLPASEGTCALFGQAVDASDMATRRRVGYMSQAFSLQPQGAEAFALRLAPLAIAGLLRDGRRLGRLRWRGGTGGFFQVRDEGRFQGRQATLAHQLIGSIAGQYLAGMHQRDAIAALGLVHEVGGNEDGHPVAARQLDHQFPEAVASHRVDPRSGLVEDQDLRLVDHRHRQRQTLADAQRQVVGQLVGHLLQVEAPEHFADPCRDTIRR